MRKCYLIEGELSEERIQACSGSENMRIGAKATFEGYVREDLINSSKVTALEFTAHPEIAIETAESLITKYITNYKLIDARIFHSLGKVDVGNKCFQVEVFASHRKEAFLALPEIVNEFKSTVPLFGKELLDDNTYVWKENKYE